MKKQHNAKGLPSAKPPLEKELTSTEPTAKSNDGGYIWLV